MKASPFPYPSSVVEREKSHFLRHFKVTRRKSFVIFVGNNAKGQISKRALQEKKGRRIVRKKRTFPKC